MTELRPWPREPADPREPARAKEDRLAGARQPRHCASTSTGSETTSVFTPARPP